MKKLIFQGGKLIKCSFLFACILICFSALSPKMIQAQGANLIPNPSVETPANALNRTPLDWYKGLGNSYYSTFSYPVSGMNNGRAVQVQTRHIFNFGNTESWAGWYFREVAIDPNVQYTYSDHYKANVPSIVRAKYKLSNGTYKTENLGTLDPATGWTKAEYTITPPAAAISMTVIHLINRIGTLVTDEFSLAQKDTAPPIPQPSISIAAPANNSTLSGIIQIAADVANAGATSSVQFLLDGSDFSAPDQTSPYSVNLDTTSIANGSHTLSAKLTGNGQIVQAPTITVIVKNEAPLPTPTITITSPSNGAVLSGSVNITASITNASPTSSVQFLLDGANLSSPDTSSPYSINFDTTSTANASHTISARLYYGAGKTIDATPITVTVKNQVTPPPATDNLILNPSFELSDTSGQPANWSKDIWLSNDAQFIYPVEGYGGGKAAKIVIQNYTSGDAKWYFQDVAVVPGNTYEFSDYYISNVKSNITFRFLTTSNTYAYKGIEDLEPSATWKKYSYKIQVPANVKSLTLFHIIESVGSLTVDNYSLRDITPQNPSFSEGMVSLTFDDARMSQYTAGYPKLQAAGIKGTFYPHMVDFLNMDTNSFYHPQQMLIMQSAGHEIGSHTRNHPHLTSLSEADLISEVEGSRSDLLGLGAAPVDSFCYPYGEYNDQVVQKVKNAGYTNARSVKLGFNAKNTDKYQLYVQLAGSQTTLQQASAWIDQAAKDKTWLILVFHQIDYSGNSSGVTPEMFNAIVDYISSAKVKTVTVSQGVGLMD